MFWSKKKPKGLVEQCREWTNIANFEFDDVRRPKRNALNEENFDTLCEKIDLILEHLKLDYVPEQYKTEPAKLEKIKEWSMSDCIRDINEYTANYYIATKGRKSKTNKKK